MQAVASRLHTRRTISEAFDILISQDEYLPSERKALVDQLLTATNTPEDNTFTADIPSGEIFIKETTQLLGSNNSK